MKGELWTWGSGGTHLGHQDSTSRCVPKCIESSRGRHIFQLVSCGQKSNFLLTSNRPPAVPLHPVTFGMDNTSSAPFPPYPRSLYLVSKLNDGSRRLHDSCRPQRSALICGGFRYSDEDNAVVVQPDFRLVLPLDWSVLAEAQRDLTVMLSFNSAGDVVAYDMRGTLLRLGVVEVFEIKTGLKVGIDGSEHHLSKVSCVNNDWHVLHLVLREHGKHIQFYIDGEICFDDQSVCIEASDLVIGDGFTAVRYANSHSGTLPCRLITSPTPSTVDFLSCLLMHRTTASTFNACVCTRFVTRCRRLSSCEAADALLPAQ